MLRWKCNEIHINRTYNSTKPVSVHDALILH